MQGLSISLGIDTPDGWFRRTQGRRGEHISGIAFVNAETNGYAEGRILGAVTLSHAVVIALTEYEKNSRRTVKQEHRHTGRGSR
mgnify:CR=1 FL=1